MNELFQSGKTQAIDLDELHVLSANRPADAHPENEFELDKWGDDPWQTEMTADGKKKRRWAEDDDWAGGGRREEKSSVRRDETSAWEEGGKNKTGWNAPKRGDVLEATDDWDDWDSGGGPKPLEMEQDIKEEGGRRAIQAASQYSQSDDSNYGSGKANRGGFGTAGIRERKGDPYKEEPKLEDLPEMVATNDWDAPLPSSSPASGEAEPDQPGGPRIAGLPGDNDETVPYSPPVAPARQSDDIPGVSRASLVIYRPNPELPAVYEVKKLKTSVGRASDNLIVLNDPYAGRHHLSINYVDGMFELFAMPDTALTSVNGYPVSHAGLMNGDLIEAGTTRIRFVFGAVSDETKAYAGVTNGKPNHIDPPPQEVMAAPEVTRQNLIRMIIALGVVLFLLIIALVIIGVTKSGGKDKKGEEAEQVEQVPEFNLSAGDRNAISSMVESLSATGDMYEEGDSDVAGTSVRIKINSTPDGARIYNPDGSLRGITPYDKSERFGKKAEKEQTWTIRLDGHAEQTLDVVLSKNVNEDVELAPEKGGKKGKKGKAEKAPKAEKPAKSKDKGSKSKDKGSKKSGGRFIL